MTLLLLLTMLLLLHCLVSRRLERTALTAPFLFAAAGILTTLLLPEARDRAVGREALLTVAELGLVLLLFTDASRTHLAVLRRIRALPARLLSIGMLLTIALGTVAAMLVFPQLSLWEAGILAAILAPTDAGLGQVIVNSERVPLKIRQALNVEAGLNDGLSVPFLLFFMALASLAGGFLLGMADRSGYMAHAARGIGVVALPVLALLVSDAVGASMFIAAFVAGLAVQVGYRDTGRHSVEFTEEWGQILNLSVFFLFGLLVASAWPSFTWSHVAYAVLSLILIRMVPVALALAGTGLSRGTVLFMGWFGPRGLASIVLGLVYLAEQAAPAGEDTIRLAVIATVILSIVAHGLSAIAGTTAYARHIDALPPDAPERGSAGATRT